MRDSLKSLPALNAAQDSLIHITIPVGMLQCNCSIIGDPVTREALVVDPGDEVTRILELLGRRRLTVKAIVSTHAHIDQDRRSTRLNSSHRCISYAVFCLKKNKKKKIKE